MEGLKILSRSACADDVKLKTKEMRLCAQTMRAQALWMSVEVVSGVRIVQCHAIMDVVIDVRVMQFHAIIDVVHWRSSHALPPSHGCCHWRSRHAL